MKIFITGGAGFIGSNLSRILYKEFKDINIIDINKKNFDLYFNKSFSKKINYYNFNLIDIENYKDIFSDCDILIHLAANGGVIDSIKDPYSNFQKNCDIALRLLEVARKKNIKKIIFASTGGALFGKESKIVNENMQTSPLSPYGASKLVNETYASVYSHCYDMNIACLRFANIYGPNSIHKNGLIQNIMRSYILNKPLNIFGDGSATRDFLYVDDLCNGINNLIKTNFKKFNIYNLSNGKEISVNNVVKTFTAIIGKNKLFIKNLHERKGEIKNNHSDNNKAKNELKFNPEYNLEKGLDKTLSWFKKNKNLL